MGEDCSGSIIRMVLAIAFIATSARHDAPCVDDEGYDWDWQTALKRYPTFFRTPGQQRAVERKYNQIAINGEKTRAPTDHSITPSSTCTFRCCDHHSVNTYPQDHRVQSCTKRQANPRNYNQNQYNACCISVQAFATPSTATTATGVNVTVVQFLPEAGQYFPTEKCTQETGCTGCTCAQEMMLHQAVVSVHGYWTVAFIQIPGCCKCYNNINTPRDHALYLSET